MCDHSCDWYILGVILSHPIRKLYTLARESERNRGPTLVHVGGTHIIPLKKRVTFLPTIFFQLLSCKFSHVSWAHALSPIHVLNYMTS